MVRVVPMARKRALRSFDLRGASDSRFVNEVYIELISPGALALEMVVDGSREMTMGRKVDVKDSRGSEGAILVGNGRIRDGGVLSRGASFEGGEIEISVGEDRGMSLVRGSSSSIPLWSSVADDRRLDRTPGNRFHISEGKSAPVAFKTCVSVIDRPPIVRISLAPA